MEIVLYFAGVFTGVLMAILYLHQSKTKSNASLDPDKLVKQMIKKYEDQNNSSFKKLVLHKIMSYPGKVTFDFLVKLTKKSIDEAFEKRNFSLIVDSINSLQNYLSHASSKTVIDLLIEMQSQIEQLKADISKRISEVIKSDIDNLDISKLIYAADCWVHDDTGKIINERIKRIQEKEKNKQLQEMISEIDEIDVKSPYAADDLQNWNAKLLVLNQKSSLSSDQLYNLRKRIDDKIRELSVERNRFKIPSVNEIMDLNDLLSKFDKVNILDKTLYKEVEHQLPRIGEIIENNTFFENSTIDIRRWVEYINNYQKSKTSAYQKYSLGLINLAHKKYDDTTFAVKKMKTKIELCQQILSETIWKIDDDLIPANIIKVMREVEDQILSKADTKGKIVLSEKAIKQRRTSINEIFDA
jgi:hypothetical protein